MPKASAPAYTVGHHRWLARCGRWVGPYRGWSDSCSYYTVACQYKYHTIGVIIQTVRLACYRGWNVAPFLPPHLSSGSHRAMTIGRATRAVPHPLALLTSSYSRLIRGLSPCREEADGYYGEKVVCRSFSTSPPFVGALAVQGFQVERRGL